MGLTNAACDFLATEMIGGVVTNFDNANANLGVGDSVTAFSTSQTDLQGSNKLRKPMDSGYPKQDPDTDGSTNKIRYQSTFGTSEGNFVWNEWGVFNAASAGVMNNREVENLGTKTSAAQWVFQVDISLTA